MTIKQWFCAPVLAMVASLCLSAPSLAQLRDKGIDLTVALDCQSMSACVTSIQEAVERAHANGFRIYVEPGEYAERVVITTPNITLIGANPQTTVIHNALAAEHAGHLHRRGWGTAGSATVTINAANVRIETLTIKNTFDFLANEALPSNHRNRITHTQAVAVLLDENSNNIVFYNSHLESYQDTLFADGGTAYFSGGSISGNIDFIFGSATVVFNRVDIIARTRHANAVGADYFGYLTAPSTNIHRNYGLVFYHCRLLREPGVPDHSYALGRPWHPTTNFEDGRYADPSAIGFAAFIYTYMDNHIHPRGWTSMKGTARDGSKTAVFYPEDSRFYELGSFGPGAVSLEKYSSRRALPQPLLTQLIKELLAERGLGNF